MDDIMGKIEELLSDEESMKQLSELAKMMMSGDESSEEDDADCSSSQEKNESPGFDFSAVMKIGGLLGAASSDDKNTGLLLALRPHLSPNRREKLDKMVKLLKLIAVYKVAKESGLIDELQL